jgi:hypothetical protein
MRPGHVIAVLAACLVLAAAADARTLYLKATPKEIVTLGGFHPSRGATLRDATRALGDPSGRRGIGEEVCRVRWSDIGLLISFSNFGGTDSCSPTGGFAQTAVIMGSAARVWRTDRGLRIGSAESAIRRLYPSATRHRDGWWVVTTQLPFGQGCPCPYPALRAKISRGRVSSFRVWIGAAGD